MKKFLPLAALCALVPSTIVHAETYTFAGTQGSSDWGVSTNFTPGGIPGSEDTLVIGVVTGTTSPGLGVTGGTRTILNLVAVSGTTQNILAASGTGGAILNITGTLTKSGTTNQNMTIRNATNAPLSVNINHLEYAGGGNLSFGSSVLNPITGLNITTVNQTAGLLLTYMENGGTAFIGSLTQSGGSIALRNLSSGTSTLQVNSLAGTGTIRTGNATGGGTGILAINSTGSSSYAGTLIDGQTGSILHVTKSGTGTQVLAGNNTYTGTTSVNAGTLVLSTTGTNNIAGSTVLHVDSAGTLDVSNVSGSGGFHLVSGQTLKGSGTIEGIFTVGSGAVLAPGNSPGTLTFNDNLTLAAGSTSNFEVNGLTSGLYDLVQSGGGSQLVSFGGTLNLVFQEGFASAGTIKIFDFEGYVGSFSEVNTSGLASGFTATFDTATGEITVVPEPSSYALLGLSLGLMLWRRVRRHP